MAKDKQRTSHFKIFLRTGLLRKLKDRLSEYKPRDNYEERIEAAVLLPITFCEDDPSLVLTKRSSSLSSHPGQVSFPGGKKDVQDGNLEYTALRETKEEIGLDFPDVSLIGRLDDLISIYGLKVRPFIGIVPENYEYRINRDELESLFTVPLSHFLNRRNYWRDTVVHNSREYNVHHFKFQDYDIWGLTAVMIIMLLNLSFDAEFEVGDRLPSIRG